MKLAVLMSLLALVSCSKHDDAQDKLDRAIERAGGIERDSDGRVIDKHARAGHADPGATASAHGPYADPASGDYGAATNPGGIDTRPGVPAGTPAPGAPEPVMLSPDEAKAGCAKKIASACGRLAVYYTIGIGVPEDKKHAEKLAKPGCDAGDPLSCYALGALYETDGKPADEGKAVDLYEKACTAGTPDGCSELAAVYMSGRTSKGADGPKAVDYLKKACALGDRTSCLQVPMVQTCLDHPTSDDPICKRMQKR
jgi:TPR repeat protein